MNCTMKDAIAAIHQRGSIDVEFLASVEALEGYAEPHMRATIVDAEDYGDSTVRIKLSYAKYDEYNRQFESANYFDRNQNPVWTAREAGHYNVDDHIFVMDTDKFDTLFKELKDTRLFDQYTAACTGESYVAWLEGQLTSANAYIKSVNEALNTGDGTYRP